jgi:hypothetical protein
MIYNNKNKIHLNKLEEYLVHILKDQKFAIKLLCDSLLRESTIWNKGRKPIVLYLLGPKDSGKRKF